MLPSWLRSEDPSPLPLQSPGSDLWIKNLLLLKTPDPSVLVATVKGQACQGLAGLFVVSPSESVGADAGLLSAQTLVTDSLDWKYLSNICLKNSVLPLIPCHIHSCSWEVSGRHWKLMYCLLVLVSCMGHCPLGQLQYCYLLWVKWISVDLQMK